MAWNAVHVWAAGEVATAANLNNNDADITFLAGTTSAAVATSQTTTSASYADLSTVGPAVTLTTGAHALVFLTCNTSNSGIAGVDCMSFTISGATTLAASDVNAVVFTSGAANEGGGSGVIIPVAVTAGSNTFTAKYRVTAGTGTFLNRFISVIPLP